MTAFIKAQSPSLRRGQGKALNVVEPVAAVKATQDTKFEKPVAKGTVKLVDNVADLINLLHNEAKAI